jgi:hypothetical protein
VLKAVPTVPVYADPASVDFIKQYVSSYRPDIINSLLTTQPGMSSQIFIKVGDDDDDDPDNAMFFDELNDVLRSLRPDGDDIIFVD